MKYQALMRVFLLLFAFRDGPGRPLSAVAAGAGLELEDTPEDSFFFVGPQLHKLAAVKILAVVQKLLAHHLAAHVVGGTVAAEFLALEPQAVPDFIAGPALNGDAVAADVDHHAGVLYVLVVDVGNQGRRHDILPEIPPGIHVLEDVEGVSL